MSRDARSRGARLRRSLAVVGLAAATVLALAAPAFAAEDPPGWNPPDPSAEGWVAFAITSGLPLVSVPASRTAYQPVTVTRTTDLTDEALLADFSNWDPLPAPSTDVGWPQDLDLASGVQLHRVAPCAHADDQCQYTVVHGGTFEVHAGTTDPTNPPTFPGPLTVPEPTPKVINASFSPNVNPTPGGVGQPGHITLDASATTDGCTDCGALSYHWTVVNVADPTKTFPSDIGPKVQLDINEDGTYCVQLTVASADGTPPVSTLSCADPSVHAPTFVATGFAPKDPSPAPTPTPTPPAGGGGGFGGISFSRPQTRAPAVLSSAGLSSPAVVWLWRPDFYKPTPDATTGAPITTNTPNLKGRHEIVVTRPGPNGASAGPWLAGMGAFGIVGGWWVFSRRRRLRMLDFEP